MHIDHMLFSENKEGSDFVVGDIHGEYDKLLFCLREVGFDFSRDRLFSVGDLIDRGPDSIKCLDLVNEKWFHACLGNHELIMLETIEAPLDKTWWIRNGGGWSLDATSELGRLVRLIKTLPYAMTINTNLGAVGICHAQPPSNDWSDAIAPNDHAKEIMTWGRAKISHNDTETIIGVERTYHGHTIVKNPVILGNSHFIDTGSFLTGGRITIEKLGVQP